ncbi:hypothetical protein A2U01_0085673, partial [Trifolium medium]|nr:hypothetical protein [Trifolium medium]
MIPTCSAIRGRVLIRANPRSLYNGTTHQDRS